jgi:hypothetical protein
VKTLVIGFALLGTAALWPVSARAHCDAVDGPVAAAARDGPTRRVHSPP